jgi:hypothetical protein
MKSYLGHKTYFVALTTMLQLQLRLLSLALWLAPASAHFPVRWPTQSASMMIWKPRLLLGGSMSALSV